MGGNVATVATAVGNKRLIGKTVATSMERVDVVNTWQKFKIAFSAFIATLAVGGLVLLTIRLVAF
jgi:hypothetical protein